MMVCQNGNQEAFLPLSLRTMESQGVVLESRFHVCSYQQDFLHDPLSPKKRDVVLKSTQGYMGTFASYMQTCCHGHVKGSDSVLVHSGCYDKALQAGWLKNSRNSLLTVVEAGNPGRSCHHGCVPLRDPFLQVCWLLTSCCVITSSLAFACKSTNFVHKGSAVLTCRLLTHLQIP